MEKIYPKIHMLSTIGVRKHYHQDYMLHENRTDFAGRNGIGKSIIADLIQLIFVQDRSLIRFGTDGVKKGSRTIEKIPYLHHQAYAYLTIEVDRNQFIVVGVCIPNDTKIPLKPFVITNQSDINKATIKDISFSRDRLVKSNHLLVDDSVVAIPDLAIHVRNKLRLALTRLDVRQYHHFLKRFNLLPVNLTVDSNLKALARVIQSFSRAKDFDPTDPKNLKNFLFDEIGDDHTKEFRQYQADLADQLKRYKDLNQISEEITSNQRRLRTLKDVETTLLQAELNWHRVNVTKCAFEVERKEQDLQILTVIVEGQKEKLQQSIKKVDRLVSQLIPTATSLTNQAYNIQRVLDQCSGLLNEYGKLDIDEKALQILNLPDLTPYLPNTIAEPEVLTIESLCIKIEELKFLLAEFQSLQAIENKVKDQELLLQTWLDETNKYIDEVVNSLKIVDQIKESGLFAEVIKRGTPLNADQETVLFHLLGQGWTTVKHTGKGAKYISHLAALDTNSIENEPDLVDSFWYVAGHLNELISRRSDPQLLDDVDRMQVAQKIIKDDFTKRLATLKNKKDAIESARNGKSFDPLQLPSAIDPRLVSQHQLTQIELSIKQAQSISGRLNTISLSKEKLNKNLQAKLSAYFVSVSVTQIPSLLEKWDKIYANRASRLNCLTDCKNSYNTETLTLRATLPQKQKELAQLQIDIQYSKDVLDKSVKDHDNFIEKLRDQHPEILAHNTNVTLNYDSVEENFLRTTKKYHDEYTLLASLYCTQDSPYYNAQIDEQVREGIYSFKILEAALLLGVGLLEDVETHLLLLNKQRMDCRRTIYDQIKNLFSKTINRYESCQEAVRALNMFFSSKKVSNRFYFDVQFVKERLSNGQFMIEWINALNKEKDSVFESNELNLGKTVDQFIEDFYQQITKETQSKSVQDLLDPKSYFNLSIRLLDDNKNEVSGSTGESYTSIILLGIGRLSVISQNGEGIKFVLLEETANIDKDNFALVMSIAAEFGYQIITMTPEPYGIGSSDEWYLHQLIPGNADPDINHPEVASYFRKAGHQSVLQTSEPS
ncbi:hypothetical protein [Spirosoma validum]|uniref:MukB N-terminal domain-containing protein n=1 Tax=Spirosoma validum TaxID=2771355 RepID=A0A927GF15_9BACT|nr:hypothetical protein [Spirosoma validum]MBD2755185.1 hypothetical protein [Spirosoma validum]